MIININKVFLKRQTEQRNIILEEISKRRDHPTAEEIYLNVRNKLPRISLGTVYRNLDRMVSKGMLKMILVNGGQRRFDPMTEEHPHFKCINCNIVEDVPLSAIRNNSAFVPENKWIKERKIDGINVEFYGLCPLCRKGNK